jgi:hypothetical protein
MRISKQGKRRDYRKIVVRLVMLVFIATLFVLGYKYLPKPINNTSEYFCGAEQFADGEFKSSGSVYTTNCFQDTKERVSGKASCRCEGDKRYGPTLSLNDLNPGDTVFVSLQVKSTKNSKSKLVFSSDKKHYRQEVISKGGDTEWKKHNSYYIIPSDAAGAVWKIYPAMVEGDGPAYFDDFSIDREGSKSEVTLNTKYPIMELQINELNFRKIASKRKEAKKVGLLFSSKDDLVDADLQIDSKEYSCLTRLKGDLLDHLRSDKWSFRVMLDGNETWRGMNIFSIHNSKARSHLAEWTMHQLMRSEGIISPKYDFMQFVLNRKTIGIYGYEQHFDNHFLTDNKKLIGPILRHNDEGYWDNVLGKLKDYEWAESSQIELFNKENEGNEQFMKLYHYGHSQLNDYFDGRKKAEEVFDLNKMAKYYALMEIGHGLHAQLMTNIRFYVDPTSALLEPIGYDFFGDHMPNVNEHWRPIGQWENGKDIIERSRDGYAYMRRLFGDLKFYERYMKHLERYSSYAYLDGKISVLDDQLKSRNDFINTDPEYAKYKYDLKHQFRKAEYTRAKLYPMPNVSLKSYRSVNKLEVILQGFHYFPLKVIGYKTQRKKVDLLEPILINAYSPDSPVVSHRLAADQKPTTIIYQTLGLDSIFYHEINNDIVPEINIPTQQALFVDISKHPGIKTIGASHIVKTATWVIDRPYLVDKHEDLAISKGTHVEFKEGGSLTIHGKIISLGTAEQPIMFAGSKSAGQGILLSKNMGESQFSHCSFSGLGSYGVGTVTLPAAVNVDEANVIFGSCLWNNNNAQTDLILSNAKFQLTNTIFQNNAGDAVRAIFSQGIINKIKIDNYGGSGLIQKGGRTTIKEMKVTKLLGWALDFDLLAISNMSNYITKETTHSLRAKGSSEVVINEYKGKTTKRDIEVTGSEKPETRVVVSNAKEAKKLMYIVEPGALLKINGLEKRTK